MSIVYKNAKIQGRLTDLVVENGKLVKIEKVAESGTELDGQEVFPGLVEVHAHGCVGFDAMEGHLAEMSEFQAKNGVTSWLPTTGAASFKELKEALSADTRSCGAEVLGFHLEGPYISPKAAGAMDKRYIRNPDWEEFSALPKVKLITLAPELDGALDFIRRCKIPVSLGHTACTFAEADQGFAAGATCITHAFNAMPPFLHREPRLIGAAIKNNAYVQVISDGHHLHPTVVLALYRIFGAERMVLISDSICAAGLPDGRYHFGGQEVIVKENTARIAAGNLAGSVYPLLSCVKQAIAFGVPKEDAFAMASRTPSGLLGLANKGRLAVGADADFIVVDEALSLLRTVVGGKTVFSR